MKVRSVVIDLEVDLNDLLIMMREAQLERVSLGEWIRKCIQFYLDAKYRRPATEEKERPATEEKEEEGEKK